MAELVFILCAVTSVACAAMLLRGYARSRARFLLWSSLCFISLAINNALLFLDKVIFPQITQVMSLDFAIWRSLTAFVGIALLVYGLIWDAE